MTDRAIVAKDKVLKELTHMYWQHDRHIKENLVKIKNIKADISDLEIEKEIISQQFAGLHVEFIPTLEDAEKGKYYWGVNSYPPVYQKRLDKEYKEVNENE